MPEKLFTYKNEDYHLFVYGTPDNVYGQAERNKGNIFARLDKPARSYEAGVETLIDIIKEKVDAHRYEVGGEHLIGTVRKCKRLTEKIGDKPYFTTTYIGRLGFANQGGKIGATIEYVEGITEQQAYDKLDEAAKTFGAKDGFYTIRRN